jgi:hypothetical protein
MANFLRWALRYSIHEITERELNWLLNTLKHDEHVAGVSFEESLHEALIIVRVDFKEGLTQPKNPYLQHLDKVNEWSHHVADDGPDLRLCWEVRIMGEDIV